jgi:diamine N-acetyltransferase
MALDTSPVTLREITFDTVISVVKLSVAESQTRFVASNAVSLSQALFTDEAWYRAVYCGEDLAGFVMLADESLLPSPPDKPEIEVWRFMIDAAFQGRVLVEQLLQVIEHVRNKDTSPAAARTFQSRLPRAVRR